MEMEALQQMLGEIAALEVLVTVFMRDHPDIARVRAQFESRCALHLADRASRDDAAPLTLAGFRERRDDLLARLDRAGG